LQITIHYQIFYTSSRGVNETNIVVSISINHLVDKHFARKLIQKLDNLASITVKLPKENIVVLTSHISFSTFGLGELLSTRYSDIKRIHILVSEEQVDVA
jgi:hypothetical protein